MLSHSIVSNSLQPHGLQPARFLCPWGFSRQEYWSGLSCLLPGDLSNPDLPHCGGILYHLSHQGSPRILEWVVSLSPLQGIFLAQESNQGLPHVGNSLPAELPGKLPDNTTILKINWIKVEQVQTIGPWLYKFFFSCFNNNNNSKSWRTCIINLQN